MTTVVVILYLMALGAVGIGCAAVARYLWAVDDRGARLIALLLVGTSMEATAVFVTIFVYPPPASVALAPLVVRLIARIVEAVLVIPAFLHVLGRQGGGEG